MIFVEDKGANNNRRDLIKGFARPRPGSEQACSNAPARARVSVAGWLAELGDERGITVLPTRAWVDLSFVALIRAPILSVLMDHQSLSPNITRSR